MLLSFYGALHCNFRRRDGFTRARLIAAGIFPNRYGTLFCSLERCFDLILKTRCCVSGERNCEEGG